MLMRPGSVCFHSSNSQALLPPMLPLSRSNCLLSMTAHSIEIWHNSVNGSIKPLLAFSMDASFLSPFGPLVAFYLRKKYLELHDSLSTLSPQEQRVLHNLSTGK